MRKKHRTNFAVDQNPIEDIVEPQSNVGYTHGYYQDAKPPSLTGHKFKQPPRNVIADTPQYRYLATRFDVLNTPIVIASANKNRRYLLIQNTGGKVGADNVFIGFGDLPIDGSRGVEVPVGTSWELPRAPNNEVQAVCAPGTSIVVVEGMVVG